jgi:hypothetical protein
VVDVLPHICRHACVLGGIIGSIINVGVSNFVFAYPNIFFCIKKENSNGKILSLKSNFMF